jgi:hypothetical protein
LTQALPNPTSNTYPADEVIDALIAGIVRVKRRVEIYESDSTTPFDIDLWDGRLVEGNVTVDRERDERRMIDVSLTNKDNALKLNPLDGFWYDKILKTFWGINYYDALGFPKAYEVQIGEFMIDRITETRFPHVVKVTGRDYAKKCLTSKIKSSMSFTAGTPIEDMIRFIAANCGITKFALPITGQTYNLDIVFERGTERWNVMKKIADSIGYEVYFRGDGYLTMRPYADPTLSPLSWIFRGGELDGTLVNFERSSNDSRIKNHIIVVGSTTTDSQFNTSVFAEAINDDPTSPTRRDRLGDRVDIIENDYFTDQETAQAFADTRLRISALEEYTVDFESVIIPWLEGSDIIDIDDSGGSAYVPSRFLLSSFNFPLGLGPMTGQGRRVTIVGSNQTLEYQ